MNHSTSGVIRNCTFNDNFGPSIETRDGVGLRSFENHFGKSHGVAGFVIWGNSIVTCVADTHDCDTTIACSVYSTSKASFKSVRFEQVTTGLVCFDSASVTLYRCSFKDTISSSIIIHSGGKIDAKDCIISSSRSIGLLLNNPKSSMLKECQFVGSNLSGVEVTNSKETIIFDSCHMSSNGQAGLYGIGSSISIKNSKILKNRQTGILLKKSTVTISNSLIEGHLHGGIVSLNCFVKFSQNKIQGNGSAGIAGLTDSTFTILNTTLSGHEEIALLVDSSKVSIDGSTFEENSGTAIQVQNPSVCTIVNSHFQQNKIGLMAENAGTINIQKSNFLQNTLHSEISKSTKFSLIDSVLQESIGEVGLQIVQEAEADIHNCQFLQDKNISILALAKITIEKSIFSQCGYCCLICNPQSSGQIIENTFKDNSQICVDLFSTHVSVVQNSFLRTGAYAIYIEPQITPFINENIFDSSGISHVCRE